MPELPEVETIARDLRPLISGAVVVGVRCDWPSAIRSHDPASFEEAVVGRRIEGVGRRGKQLLVSLSGRLSPAPAAPADALTDAATDVATHGADPDPAVLTIHLKMTGQLFVVPAGTTQDRHVHLVLELEDGRELRFRDIRKFGRVGLYRRDPETGEPLEGEAVGVLATGPEPLADDFTPGAFRALLARRRGRLKPLLTDQTVVAGVGNIYADEALWRARIHPLRQATTLRPEEVARLHAALRDVLGEAVARRGSSVDDYTAPEGDGSMQEHLNVYQRAGEGCPRCGRPIRRIVLGGRSTHFCSWCQRLSAAERHAAHNLLAETHALRPGQRWTELPGAGAIGRTAQEERRAAQRARRMEALRNAAATRRATARGEAPSAPAAPASSSDPASDAGRAEGSR